MYSLGENNIEERLIKTFNKDGLAVTFTLKERFYGQRIDPICADECFRHFSSFLSRRIYGSANKRFNKKHPFFYSIEKGSLGRFHAHTLIPFPSKSRVHFFNFKNVVLEEWRKIRWANDVVKVNYLHDCEGWVRYCLKQRTKVSGVFDAVGWYE